MNLEVTCDSVSQLVYHKKQLCVGMEFSDYLVGENVEFIKNHERSVVKKLINNFFYERMLDDVETEVELDRPTFLEWLFRKKRRVYIRCKAVDVLKNPQTKTLEDYLVLYYFDPISVLVDRS